MEIEIATIFYCKMRQTKCLRNTILLKNTCKSELKTGKNESGMRN